jgi:type I restriction enzyme M protein
LAPADVLIYQPYPRFLLLNPRPTGSGTLSPGEKKNDGGQFFTPREVIRVVVRVVNPQLGRTVYDPCAGTCGFLIEAFKHLMAQNPTGTQIQQLKTETFWAREDAAEAILIALANMVLHGVDLPRL